LTLFHNTLTWVCLFFANESFNRTADYFLSRATSASRAVTRLIRKAHIVDPITIRRLFTAKILPALLYAAPIWSLRYIASIETFQVRFLKNLYFVERHTSSALLRLDLGFPAVESRIIKHTLKFWSRLLDMPDTSLPPLQRSRVTFLAS
jgi:hypothetical protein